MGEQQKGGAKRCEKEGDHFFRSGADRSSTAIHRSVKGFAEVATLIGTTGMSS